MGAHKTNGMALLAKGALDSGDIGPIARAVTECRYDYGFEIVTEPNKAKSAEIQAHLDAELAAGKDPKDINVNFALTPEDQDIVVYHRIRQLREIKITQQVVACNIRGPEHFRMPLAEVMNRAQQALDGGPSENKA